MSPPDACDVSPPGRGASAAPVAPAGATPAAATYWWIVWKQFRKRTTAVAAFVAVLLLFVLAWFAPLAASDRPLVMKDAGGVSFPALRSLFGERYAIDRFFNGGLLVLPLAVAGALVWRSRKPKALRPDWLDTVALALPPFVLAWVVAGGLMMAATRFVNDPRDYPAEARRAEEAGAPGWYVFPPVRFGPHYQDRAAEGPGRPTADHWLGTDSTSRDVLAFMIHGTRIAFSVGFVAVGIATVIGVFVGGLMGYFGGWVDIALSRLVEIMICFPTLFLIIILIVAFGQSIFLIMLAIGITGWTGVARLTRGEFLKLRRLDFVTGAQALGAGRARIMFHHMLPNSLGPVLVSVTFGVAGAILSEAGLSFLGLGDVSLPSWGKVLHEGEQYYSRAWWLVFFPGLAVFVTVVLFNLVGEGLRDAMDPRLRE